MAKKSHPYLHWYKNENGPSVIRPGGRRGSGSPSSTAALFVSVDASRGRTLPSVIHPLVTKSKGHTDGPGETKCSLNQTPSHVCGKELLGTRGGG
ncbi:rCG20685, isoform CRA_a [Rattus norvegicus]|uniref:CPG1 n=2 Tax=Rattus norvegicus TaxID=10116 RepID=A6JEF6_RAT|nr:candidate plasticity gene 1 [Rattus norvegicus]EDL81700.1 rCG20685, isoform CRA_a [Rattus norvegicus]CAA51724.1 CPG1 [Rattus norvegicus]prf//1916414A candidate plasticity-related gene [Rattus norvegicus]|eukprot:NP_835205.1 candidate plasticity gene 1 [Rattus norvegicus]